MALRLFSATSRYIFEISNNCLLLSIYLIKFVPIFFLLRPLETKIIYTEPGVKGDTATNATKLAKIETGAEIQVPLFINENDKVKIDIRQGKYVERVK